MADQFYFSFFSFTPPKSYFPFHLGAPLPSGGKVRVMRVSSFALVCFEAAVLLGFVWVLIVACHAVQVILQGLCH